ncbi:MAG: hypothetical protein WC556_08630 [Candidatus Methanoperedens sp.]
MSTEVSFDHLDVINSVLSLAFNLESYPNHLYKAGYHISRIEPQFNVNGTLNPDIFFISDERGLFCECKSDEYFIGNNLKQYQKITIRNLVEKGIDVPKEEMEFDVGIFGKENIESLKDRLAEKGITYPQVVIDEFIQKRYGDDFKDPVLRELFSEPVKINSKPLLIIKFVEDSPFKKIAPFIFNTLMSRSVSRRTTFTSRELTEESLGEIWDHLDKDLQKSLNGKIRRFLKHCKSHELNDYLSNREDVWIIEINEHWKSRKKFSDDCNRLMGNLSQKILFDFGFEEENE